MPQVHYPSIERQDLTQGQLGSFKFTPVDSTSYPTPNFEPRGEARRLWQARAQARARMRGGRDQKSALERGAWQQYSHRARSQSPNKFDQNDSSYASAMSQSTQPQTPDSLRDQTFFNEHVKQDLEDSRLRLGATGFRSAVRGNSPERGSIHYPERHNQLSPTYSYQQGSQGFQSMMHPQVDNVEPIMSPMGLSQDETKLLNDNLCRAFINEREAHQATQDKLDAYMQRTAALEAELSVSADENKKLMASTKMLQSIIKHNESRLQRCDKIEAKQTIKANGTADTTKTKTELSEQVKVPQLANEYQSADSPTITEETEGQDATLVKQLSPVQDHSKLFNLDLLNNRESVEFSSACGRKLRKHFSMEELSSSDSDGAENKVMNFNSLGELVHISPPEAKKLSLTPIREEANIATKAASKKMEGALKYAGVNLHTADDGLFELPASFLNKYSGAKKRDVEKKVETFIDTPALGFVESGASGSNVEKTPAVEPMRFDFNDPSIAPLDLSIKWKVTKENPIYENAERVRARGYQTGVFWRHPVRFLDYGDKDKNIFRTVMIDYIPKDATYQDVLGEIRGGALEKIELVPAIGRATDYQTARVVFNFEIGASTTANYARDHGMIIKGKPVRVWQVITQTYPKNDTVDRDVFEEGYTRILIIDEIKQEALTLIPDKLAHLKSSIVGYTKTFDDYPMIEFTSVAAATSALRVLTFDTDLGGVKFDFGDDYCGKFGHD